MLLPGRLFDLDHDLDEGHKPSPASARGGASDVAQRVRLTYGREQTVELLDRWAADLTRYGLSCEAPQLTSVDK